MVPLAALIADSLGINPLQSEWQGATVIAVAKSSESLYWAAILADGEPLPGRHEMSFRDVDALNAWVQTECRPGEVARLYASRGVLRDVQVTVESWQLDEEDAANPELVPVFEVRAMPRLARATGGLAALGMVLFGGWTAADEFYFSRLNREGETRMVAFETPIDLFLANCHEELRKPWPVPPGWQTESSGCTTSSMDDPHVLQVPFAGGSAYRMFSLAAGHDGTLARAAAKQLLAGFDGWWSVDDQAILLQRPVDVPLRPAGAGQPTVFEELRVETEGIFLGLGAEIVIENDTIVLTSSASVPTVVRLLVELHRRQPISLNRFTRSREGLQVVLLPRQTIMVAESQPASS